MKKIKLILKGRKKDPIFHLVSIDSRLKYKYISKLGYYNPKKNIILINYKNLLQNIKLGASSTKNVINFCIFQLKFNLTNFNLLN